MSEEKLTRFLESSFLKPLLAEKEVTDISYNGASLYYEDSLLGRKRSPLKLTPEEVGDFLRQIANLSEKQFSYQSPILDVSFGRYRLNAAFLSLVRVKERKSYSFSLRLASGGSKLDSCPNFFGGDSQAILMEALAKRESIVIGGATSSGKTELQKYLLLHLKENTRVIVIDNVEELEMCRDEQRLDLTSWLVDERFPSSNFPALIRNALRNDPDYIVVAESRGGEMLDVLNSAMSGHALVLTLHSKDLASMPYRMARMAMMGEQKLIYEDVLGDIYHHFSLFVYLRKDDRPDGSIDRYIQSIGRLNEKKKGIDILYERKKEIHEAH
jgi:pilus assembly protein CpaF